MVPLILRYYRISSNSIAFDLQELRRSFLQLLVVGYAER